MKRFILASLIVLAFCGRNYACGHAAVAVAITPAAVVVPSFVAVTPAVISNVAVVPAVAVVPTVVTPAVVVNNVGRANVKVKVRGGGRRVKVRVR